jgi:hypothetical protein
MKIHELYAVSKVKPKAEVGIEVEMEGRELPRQVPMRWRVTTDGSLRGEAFEYVLAEPIPRNQTEDALAELWRQFREVGSRIAPSDRCGVHVHVNCQDMTIDQVYNFITAYLVFEDLIVKWCGEDREGNLFCLRAQDAEWLVTSLINDKAGGQFLTTSRGNTFRYASINISALPKYGSLEFRSLRTPMSYATIQKFINIVLSVKDYALGIKDIVDVLTACSSSVGGRLVYEVFGKTLGKELLFPGAERVMLNGARRVQALAYTKLKDIPVPVKKKSSLGIQGQPRYQLLSDGSNRYYDRVLWWSAYLEWEREGGRGREPEQEMYTVPTDVVMRTIEREMNRPVQAQPAEPVTQQSVWDVERAPATAPGIVTWQIIDGPAPATSDAVFDGDEEEDSEEEDIPEDEPDEDEDMRFPDISEREAEDPRQRPDLDSIRRSTDPFAPPQPGGVSFDREERARLLNEFMLREFGRRS